MFHWTKYIFSATDRDFLPKIKDLQRKEFSRVLENFTEIASRITTFTMFYSVFQNYAEEINKQSLVMFNVQRR